MKTIDAAIFDTDGVITQTAAVHFTAWKNVFDDYLQANASGSAAAPFTDADYRMHVDGIGRYDGVNAFLKSRGIDLPWGSADDAPGDQTVCAVGNKKNAAFEHAVKTQGVRAYLSTRRFIEALHAHGVRTAVISASKNCEMVLQAAGMDDLFEVRVDGNDAAELGFPGKPAPDVFLQAADRMGIEPARAAVIEDAIKGVEAGRAGDFGLVIGLDRTRNPVPLEQFADIVVPDLSDLGVEGADGAGAQVSRVVPAHGWLPALPDATIDYDLTRQVSDKSVAVFCDYDGALTPIVERPELATLSPEMRAALKRLAEFTVVGVVSGRDLDDVMGLVGLDGLWYAGSHGWDVHAPDGQLHELSARLSAGTDALAQLDAVEAELPARISGVEGAWMERKRAAIAVHYRATPDDAVAGLQRIVDELAAPHDHLQVTGGKRVFEVRPAVHWNKGKAVEWLQAAAGLDPATTLPIFIGDDVTDEDGFSQVRSLGVGIVVGTEERFTAAHLRVDDPAGVRSVLESLAEQLEEASTESGAT